MTGRFNGVIIFGDTWELHLWTRRGIAEDDKEPYVRAWSGSIEGALEEAEMLIESFAPSEEET